MKHPELTKADQHFLRRHLKLSSACHCTTELCSTVPLSEAQQRHWLYRVGCEVKVRFCCLINLLSLNLLVCYEIKVNSDEVIKEYYSGQRAGTVTPKLCPGHRREQKSSFHSCSASFVPVLLPSQSTGSWGCLSVDQFIPGPSSSASWCIFRSRDNYGD